MKAGRVVVLALACAAAFFPACAAERNGTTILGERLFFETRFAQYFFARSGGDANFSLTAGDPVMEATVLVNGTLPGPFAGQSMNCRACHLVQEQEAFGNRAYADFAARSPVPANGDGRTQTPRNAISLVNVLQPRPTPLFLHYDGQFASAQDLVLATLTGRNFGWKPSEYALATAHIAHIIRQDDGKGALAQRYGGLSYAQVFAAARAVPSQYQILPAYRLPDVTVTNSGSLNYASDQRVVQDVAALIQAYLGTLVFSQDTNGLFNGSPYDVFLMKNGLPRAPTTNETPAQYSQRLLGSIEKRAAIQFVTDPADGHFSTHKQPFQFGPAELAGLKIFFAQGPPVASSPVPTSIGNCVVCHPPPAFTDFLFHNTGATQEEYDAIHGPGTFMTVAIPELSERQANYDAFLPATPNHPTALGTFITPPSLNQPGQIDLGLWNVFANPDFPAAQPGLRQILPQLLAVPVPRIDIVTRGGGKLVFRGTNGTPGRSYSILTATNLSTPPSGWVVISTNTFDSAGGFSSTNPLPSAGTAFYALSAAPPSPSFALPRLVALFKTPPLRDLGSSDPYLHTGRMNTLENVISFYQNFSQLARANGVRNADPQLSRIFLDNSALAPLSAFLRALNEDYLNPPCPCLGNDSRPNVPPASIQR